MWPRKKPTSVSLINRCGHDRWSSNEYRMPNDERTVATWHKLLSFTTSSMRTENKTDNSSNTCKTIISKRWSTDSDRNKRPRKSCIRWRINESKSRKESSYRLIMQIDKLKADLYRSSMKPPSINIISKRWKNRRIRMIMNSTSDIAQLLKIVKLENRLSTYKGSRTLTAFKTSDSTMLQTLLTMQRFKSRKQSRLNDSMNKCTGQSKIEKRSHVVPNGNEHLKITKLLKEKEVINDQLRGRLKLRSQLTMTFQLLQHRKCRSGLKRQSRNECTDRCLRTKPK